MANISFLAFLPLSAKIPESNPMCPTVPYDVIIGEFISFPSCGLFSLDIAVDSDDFPIKDVVGINFEILISNYMDFELDLTLTEASMNSLFEDRGLEVNYNSGTGQLFLSEAFGLDPIDSLDISTGKNYALIVTLYFTLKPGSSTYISYGSHPTLALDFNGDGIPETCFPDNVSLPVQVNSPGYFISGEFETINTQNYSCGELVDVNIEFSDAGGILCDDDSDSGGEYESCGLCPGGTFRATPISGPLTDTLCGGTIDTSDIVAIRDHLLDLVPFTQVWQYFAADCNGDLTVSAKDMVVIQRAILHYPIPDYVPWTYWTKASIDAISLPHVDPIGAGVSFWEFSNLSEDKTMKDFYGVRTMQVHLNGQPCHCANNINENPEARSMVKEKESASNFLIRDRLVDPGEQILVTFQNPLQRTLLGFDISLRLIHGLEVQDVQTHTDFDPELIAESYRIGNKKKSVRLMFDQVDPAYLEKLHHGDLISLTVYHNGNKPLWLSEMIGIEETEGSNYIRIGQNKPPPLNLQFTGSKYEEIQVVPNPVRNEFRFYSDSKWENMTAFDLSGKALKAWDKPNTGVAYSMEELPAGVYVLRFDGSSNSKSVRIIKR